MRVVMIVCAAAAMSLFFPLSSPSPDGLFAISQAQAQASDALARKCRKAVFDRYGQSKIKSGRPVRSLRSSFVQSAVDSCVANGGRVI
jgi:hypothetical protein